MEIITRKEAKEQGLVKYFNGNPCKHGHISYRLTVSGYCYECSKNKSREIYTTYYKQYAKENKEKIKKICTRYQKNNKGKVNARTAARHAAKMQRTPKWLNKDDKWIMQEIYDLAVLRTQATKLDWHVDHIIPMQGDTVSGLHCPENLQIILAKENCSKSNRWDWDQQK